METNRIRVCRNGDPHITSINPVKILIDIAKKHSRHDEGCGIYFQVHDFKCTCGLHKKLLAVGLPSQEGL